MNTAEKIFNTPEGAFKVFSIYQNQMSACRFDIKDKSILNIGAGDLIGLDILFLLAGARRVISIDLQTGNYKYPDITTQQSFFDKLWGLAKSSGMSGAPEPWPDILLKENGRVRYNTDRLVRISPASACELPLKDNLIDFAFSNAVFEHIARPEEAVEEIARTLSSGGHTMHRVDLRDHRDFSKPLEFLKPGEPSRGCNLWRAHQFREAFEKNGLEILDFDIFERCNVTEKERDGFIEPFRTLPCEELEKLRFMIYARKG